MPTITKQQAIRMGIPKKTLQTIELPKNKYTLRSAKKWLKDNNFVNSYYRTTVNYYRFMQSFPIRGAGYYSRVLPNGVILVMQEY